MTDTDITAEHRAVFFVSESTGITAETLGHSLLSQFPEIKFHRHYRPFINTVEGTSELIQEFEESKAATGHLPIVFATMPIDEINALLRQAPCHYYELYNAFLEKLGVDLHTDPAHEFGRSHGVTNGSSYDSRIDTINFALSHDDAMNMKNLNKADVILVGVSRSGKTPTSLYLALHFGSLVANYPLTEDDFKRDDFPAELIANKEKLVALTIDPKRLHEVREKRRSGSPYASLAVCQSEVKKAEEFFQRYGLQAMDTTNSSIEELASRIVRERGLDP